MYVIESIGGLFDGAPLPLDQSWIPPELRPPPGKGGVLPDGTPITPSPSPAPSSPELSPMVSLLAGAAVGGAIVYLLLRR